MKGHGNKKRHAMTTMTTTEMIELANKTVKGFVNKKFPNFFSNDDIKDIVQDTVCRMWEKRDTYDPEKGTAFAWAWTIAKNKVLDAAAAKARRTGLFARFEDGEIPVDCEPYMVDANDYLADSELLYNERVDGLFNTLTSDRDKLLLAWVMDGLDNKEIAERLGVSVNTVYMATYHMRERLKRAV